MTHTILTTFLVIIGSLAGVCLGAFLAKNTARDILVKQAKAEFDASFSDVLVELATRTFNVPENFSHVLLKEHFTRHLLAYFNLRAALPNDRRLSLDKAWKKYTGDDEKSHPEEQEFERFSVVFRGNTTEERNMFATKHIRELLNSDA